MTRSFEIESTAEATCTATTAFPAAAATISFIARTEAVVVGVNTASVASANITTTATDTCSACATVNTTATGKSNACATATADNSFASAAAAATATTTDTSEPYPGATSNATAADTCIAPPRAPTAPALVAAPTASIVTWSVFRVQKLARGSALAASSRRGNGDVRAAADDVQNHDWVGVPPREATNTAFTASRRRHSRRRDHRIRGSRRDGRHWALRVMNGRSCTLHSTASADATTAAAAAANTAVASRYAAVLPRERSGRAPGEVVCPSVAAVIEHLQHQAGLYSIEKGKQQQSNLVPRDLIKRD